MLGAMLPDFVSMLKARMPSCVEREITSGIAFHHVTDEVFHRTRTFAALSHQAFSRLLGRNVRRGTARAVAHVGIEILIDTTLRHDRTLVACYRAALEAGGRSELGRYLAWEHASALEEWEHLRRLLIDRSLAPPDTGAAALTKRLARALEGRPRLELIEGDRPAIVEWVRETEPLVMASVENVLSEVWQGLLEAESGTGRVT